MQVDFTRHDDASKAMAEFNQWTWPNGTGTVQRAIERDPRWTVAGLGDEAFVVPYPLNPDDTGATALFRHGGTLVRAVYGRGFSKTEKLLGEEGMAGALKVITDAARAIGAPATPLRQDVADPSAPAPVTHVPAPCSLPSRLIAELTPESKTAPSTYQPLLNASSPAKAQGCRWSSTTWNTSNDVDRSGYRTRVLTVSIMAVPERRRGVAVPTAEHEYVRLHLHARARRSGFQPITGLGEQAFGSHGVDSADGGTTVVFRIRNVLVVVTHKDETGRKPTGQEANGAYTAAVEIARRIKA
ncbi:hypothetical protein ACQEU3_38465 [Spirillospora sp. CA-253888]